jgi:hypothetical protein
MEGYMLLAVFSTVMLIFIVYFIRKLNHEN